MVNLTFDLMADLGASDDQLDFPILYGSGRNGWMADAPDGAQDGMAPLFDLVLLGIGTNGHTASLFPGEAVVGERKAWAADVTPPGEPTRITLTWPPLESCRAAAFLVAASCRNCCSSSSTRRRLCISSRCSL